jgi:hypothetical protein
VRQTVATVGKFYAISVDVANRASGNIAPSFSLVRQLSDNGSYVWTARADVPFLTVRSRNSPVNLTIDNVSLKELPFSSCMAGYETGKSNVSCKAGFSLDSYINAGIVLNLDDTVSPQNFVLAYMDRFQGTERIRLDKYVSGVISNLISIPFTYSEGAELKVEKSGTTYKVFYGGTQVGTDQTISDASIIDNTKHGAFSTSADSVINNLEIRRN